MAKSSIYILPSEGGGLIHFDVVSEIGLPRVKTITKNPISRGNYISDHISEREESITLECGVTDSPIQLYEGNLITSSSSETRSQAAYILVKSLYENEVKLTLVHKFDARPNMVLIEFTPIILPSNAIGFRLRFESVRYAHERRVLVTENMTPAKAALAASGSSEDGGTEETDPEVEGSLTRQFLIDYLPKGALSVLGLEE